MVALDTVTTVGYGDVTPQNGPAGWSARWSGSSTAAVNRLLSTLAGAAVGLLATALIPVPKPPEQPAIRAPADPEAV